MNEVYMKSTGQIVLEKINNEQESIICYISVDPWLPHLRAAVRRMGNDAGSHNPPVNAQTLYVCVMAEKGAPYMNMQGFKEIIPKGRGRAISGACV